MSLDSSRSGVCASTFHLTGPTHYLWNSQAQNLTKKTLKLSPTRYYLYLKIILLQYFQQKVFNFQQISGIQTDP